MNREYALVEDDDFDCGSSVWFWEPEIQDYRVNWWFHEDCEECREIEEIVVTARIMDEAGLL